MRFSSPSCLKPRNSLCPIVLVCVKNEDLTPFQQLSFLLNMLLKRFSPKGQSPCHHQILLSLLLLLSWGSNGGWGKTSCWCSTSCWGRSTSPRIADEASDVDIGQSLCKQAWPERLHIYTGCFNEGIDFILHDHAEWGQSRCRWALRWRPWWGRVLGGGCQARC